MKRFLPIRKVVTGLVASGLFYAAHRAGFTFGQADADQAAQGLVGFAVAYIVPDPRVQSVVGKVSDPVQPNFGTPTPTTQGAPA